MWAGPLKLGSLPRMGCHLNQLASVWGSSPTFKAPLLISAGLVFKNYASQIGAVSDGTCPAEETLLVTENPWKSLKTQPNMDGHLITTKDSFRPCRPPTSAMKKVGPICFPRESKFSHCAFQLMALHAKCLKNT